MDLGETIKIIRKQKGIKQNTFAELCNITQAYLSQIENNLKEPNLSTLRKIAEKLSVPLPILFFLSMNEEDVASDKKEAYTMIAPSVKSLLNQFFSSLN
jgi:transcriptional regulator with XRE-family HTH domain